MDTGLPHCKADPNRIFSTDAVTRANAFTTSCTCPERHKDAAVEALREFHDQELAPAISRCRGGNGTGLSGPLPVVAFHNNDQRYYSIHSYQQGGEEAGATEVDTARTGGIANPSIDQPERPDDFLLVTQPQDFTAFTGSRNVVLQSTTPKDDGSLSVALAGERYINIESEEKHFDLSRNLQFFINNRDLAVEVLEHLGVPKCPSDQFPPQSQPPQQQGSVTPPQTQSERPANMAELLRELYRFCEQLQQLHTMPLAFPRETIRPQGLPDNCKTFNNQAELDREKTNWTNFITSLDPAYVVNWITGFSEPPENAAIEAEYQKEDCLLYAIQQAQGVNLPSTTWSSTEPRDFSHQRDTWRSEFTFLRTLPGRRDTSQTQPFGHITGQARNICGSLINATDTQWDPHNPAHRVCWDAPPIPGTSPPAIPPGARVLNPDERQVEILQVSSAPGISRHHWGTDFDLFDPNRDPSQWQVGGTYEDVYSWMRGNAATYGFIQAFTPWSSFMRRGYVEERWHWSYYPIAQALLEFARSHQTEIERALLSRWGSDPQYSFIRQHWRDYMLNVNERGTF